MGDANSAEIELRQLVQMAPLNVEKPSPMWRLRALAKALLGDFLGAEDDCRIATKVDRDRADQLYTDQVYFACVCALEAQHEPNSDARLHDIRLAVAQLKADAIRKFDIEGFLEQFDDLKILDALSQSPEFQEFLHSSQTQPAGPKASSN